MSTPLAKRWAAQACREDGGAVVETAVLMIVMVPLLLFIMWAGDAGRHLIDVQEAVVSTTWDLSQQSYSNIDENAVTARSNAPGFVDNTVAAYGRVQYADHDSSYSGERGIDASGKKFTGNVVHTAAFAQVSWCNGGNCEGSSGYTEKQANPVHCSLDQSVGKQFVEEPGAAYYAFVASAGGVATCWAKAWLYNYLVPQTFLKGFGDVNKVKLTGQKQHNEKNPESISGNTQNDLLLKYQAALFVDTWAVGDGSNIVRSNGFLQRGTGPNKAFFNRTAVVFSNPTWYALPAANVATYATQARSRQLANIVPVPENALLPVGPNTLEFDNPTGLAMSAHYENGRSPSLASYKDDGFYTTPMYGPIVTVYNNRGGFYLGSRTAERR